MPSPWRLNQIPIQHGDCLIIGDLIARESVITVVSVHVGVEHEPFFLKINTWRLARRVRELRHKELNKSTT